MRTTLILPIKESGEELKQLHKNPPRTYKSESRCCSMFQLARVWGVGNV